jgi:poly-beta-1,6-N-acetyl-D-glucosamine synthase
VAREAIHIHDEAEAKQALNEKRNGMMQAPGRHTRAYLEEWGTKPLPRVVLPPRPQVVVLIPAYNEEDAIQDTIKAANDQSFTPDHVMVIVNNTTDDTELVALATGGAEVVVMKDNPHKKAGALNFGLSRVLPFLGDDDLVLIQDADTNLNHTFIEDAVKAMAPGIGGVCARYDSPKPGNILERLQANEFARSRQKITRDHGKVKILVGIASVFRAGVIRDVIAARGAHDLPGNDATFYNNDSLTEDYELTLSLLTLGYKLISPKALRPHTHAMPTPSKLWGQRVRWTRGSLDDLERHGYNKITRPYIIAQIGRILAMLSPVIFAAYLISLQLTFGRIVWDLPWVAVNAIFIGERVWTVREEGIRGMFVALLLFPELLYDWFMAVTYLTGLTKHLRGSAVQWKET